MIALASACAKPKPNTVMGRMPNHSWHGPIGQASYSAAGLVTVDLGSHTQLTTVTCFEHANTKIGIDSNDARVAAQEDGAEVVAIEGALEIEECSPQHLRATMWARFADGGRVEASINAHLKASNTP
ncbi:hypothetical protein BH11MYX1_BH11MYX1_26960 [soil metagenome]